MSYHGRVGHFGVGKKSEQPGTTEYYIQGFSHHQRNSSFLNLDCVKDLAHHAESMLAQVRDDKDNFTTDHADLALKSLDMIKSILERMKSSGPGQQIELTLGHEELLEALKNFSSGTQDPKVNNRSAEPVMRAKGQGKAGPERRRNFGRSVFCRKPSF